MYYDIASGRHGLKFDPFKALVAPRPIGWIATIDRDGRHNLAPYSFFNAVSDHPPVVMFSSGGRKDSLHNIEQNGEFTCSMATWALREQMNLSSAPVSRGVDEFALAGLTPAASHAVKPARVAESPAAFECRHWKTVEMPEPVPRPGRPPPPRFDVVFGIVVGVYIDDAYLRDGLVETARMRPIARMGYMDYAVVTPETTFTLNRPTVSDDGRSAEVVPGEWDGVYR
ncbi:MAG: flavin reductase family protein [Burkholderiales bacterium]